MTAAILSGGGTLGGTASVNTSAGGLATFAGLSIAGTIGSRTLQFTSAGLTTATSSAINITAGAATQLVMVQQPSALAASGAAFAQQPTVQVQDASGNSVSGIVSVTAAILSGGGALGGTATVSTSAGGLATFANLAITGMVGARTLQFTSGALTPATSSSVAITAGAASQLVIVQQPSASAADGAVFAQQPTVQVQDASGNPVSTVVSVTAAIATGGGALGGTATVTTSAGGLATFAGLSISGTVGARTLQFTSGVLTPDTSTAITIAAGAPTQMTISTGNTQTATVGTAVSTAPAVLVRDASGNPVSGVSVTFAVASGGGSALPVAAVTTNASGIAAATSWTLGTVAGANSLTATAAPGGITTNPITFTATGAPGAATQLVIVQQPSATAASGAIFAQQPTVQVRDALGNAAPGVVSVTAAIATGGGTLGGTATVNTDAGGLATFAGLSISGTVGSRTLRFTSGVLTPDTSTVVSISAGAPTQMTISVGNGQSAVAGTSVTTAPAVLVRDVSDNPVSGVLVTFAAATGGGSALPVAAVATNASGVATATSWTLGTLAGPNTLTATAAPAGITPNPVTFTATGTPGAATALAITTAPTAGQSGLAVAPQPVVRLVDINGNTVTTTGTLVTATFASGTGTLAGATASTVAGVATFTSLSVTGLVGNYSLRFDAPSLTGVTGASFPITAGTPVALAFIVQPVSTAAGSAIPSPQVEVRDGAGNRVTTATTSITLGFGSNPGGSTLSGTVTQSAVAGVATFPGLSLNRTGTGYTFTADGGALPQATSSAFNITPGAPASVAFVGQPSAVTAGASIAPAVTVEIRDALSNLVTTSTASVTVAIGTNPPGTGVLSGTTTLNAVAGVATFSNLSINRSGIGYTLNATSGALVGPASSAFTVDPGVAFAVAITSAPTAGTNGVALTPPAVVRLVDVLGNTVPTTGTTVTALLASGAGALGGTTFASTTSGVATFTNLILTGTAGPYTINFGSAGLGGITSSPITLGAGTATTIGANSTPAASGTVGTAVTPLPAVLVTDGGGNPVSGVAVTFAVTAGNGSITGGATTTNGSGVATVGSWTRDLVVGADTLTATAAGLSGSPVRFTTAGVAGAANSISANSLTSQSAVVGTAVGAPPSVLVRDVGLNPVAGVPVTFAVTGGSGTVLPGTAVLTNASGIATATSWTLGTVAGTNNNTVTASAAVPSGSPVAFTASGLAGAANAIAANSVIAQSDTVALPVAAPPSVIVTDLSGNPVSGVSVTFTVTGGGGSIVPVTATPVVTNTSGIATLTSWTLGTTAGANTLTATAAVPSGSPVNFTATGVAGAPTALVFGTQPSGAAVGGTITPAVTVRLQDASGNLTTSTASVGLAIGNNPGSATLGGTVSRAAVGGIATFNDLTLSTAGVGYTLNASSVGLPTIPSAAFTIGLAASTTAITSDLPDPSVVGQPYTVNFTVTGAGATPTGNVTVADGTGPTCVATVAVGGCALTSTTIGTKTLTATYAGDVNYTGGSSAGAAHVVNQASTITVIGTHTPDPSTRGAPVTVAWTVPVTAPGAGTPTGNVTVGDGVNSCVAAVGLGGCAITLTTVGTRPLTAVYAGDANFLTSTSAVVNQVVNQAASTTTITNDTPDPSVVGEPFAVSFTVTGPGGTPTGNVSVSDGVESCIGTAAAGTCNLTLTTVGSRPLTATYVGDANYTGSASLAAPHTVNQAATTTSITSFLPTTADTLTPVAVNWSVLPVGPGAGTPTGTVVVTTDGAETCSAAVGANSCSLTFASSGPRLVTVSYQGDTRFLAGATAATPYAVTP